MQFVIEKASLSDAKKVNDLLTKLIIDEKKYDENINRNCIVKSFYEKIYDDQNVCLLVAKTKEKKEIIRYLYGYIRNDGDSTIYKTSVLDALYVEKNYRKIGCGKKLIETFKKWSLNSNARYIELKVCIQNKEAINLYLKEGIFNQKNIMRAKI